MIERRSVGDVGVSIAGVSRGEEAGVDWAAEV
jgi:hypothetical protein